MNIGYSRLYIRTSFLFYIDGYLRPEALQQACQKAEQPLTLRYHAGYDHSYYFIQTVIEDHIEHHYNAALTHG